MSNGYVTAGHPAHAVILTRPAPRVLERWLIARVPVWKTYPCACELGRPCNTRNTAKPLCPCWGRLDADLMLAHCCAARAARDALRRQGDISLTHQHNQPSNDQIGPT